MNCVWCPIFLTLFIPLFVFVVYLSAVYHKTVDPIFPYISDCAIEPPQAAYFTLSMSISVIIFIFFGLLRFNQTKTVVSNIEFSRLLNLTDKTEKQIINCNNITLIAGSLICLAFLCTGTFRVEEHHILHTISSLIGFICIPVLFWAQIVISFHFSPYINKEIVSYLRLYLTIVTIICLLVLFVFTVWSYLLFTGNWRTDRLHWKPADGGYVQHLMAASAEWALILMITLFLMTFIPEFKRLEIDGFILRINI